MNTNGGEVVKRLLELGFKKWTISEFVYGKGNAKKGWNNVHAWSKGWWNPDDEHMKKLAELLDFAENGEIRLKIS